MNTNEIENFNEEVVKVIQDWFKTRGFKQRKLTDTPTDALQVVNKKYADSKGLPTSPNDATQFLNGNSTPAFAQVKDSDLAFTDITTNNVSTSKHGFAPKVTNTSNFLKGDGTWSSLTGLTYKVFSFTRAGNTASNTQNIAHGFGAVPKYIIISAGQQDVAGNTVAHSIGVYDGTNIACEFYLLFTTNVNGLDTSNIINIKSTSGGGSGQTAGIGWDSTNISLFWTYAAAMSANNINVVILIAG